MVSIIAINPGSTSTKLAICSVSENFRKQACFDYHEVEKVDIINKNMSGIFQEELKERRKLVKDFIKSNSEKIGKVIAVTARGGLLKPLKGGVYRVNKAMIDDLVSCRYGTHASNMGAPLAQEIADLYNVKAYIAYPVVVDEMDDIARYTGIPEIKRRSYFHALNQKTVAKMISEELEKNYEDLVLIIAHLGGGITVGLHAYGRVVDVNNGLDGDGPFSIERAGGIPAGDLVRLCFCGRYTYEDIYEKIVQKGGIYAYLGTKDAVLLEDIILEKAGSYRAINPSFSKKKIKEVIDAWIYQVSKSICALACYTCGKVDAVILTGGLAKFDYFVQEIKRRVSFLTKIYIVPGEEEMRGLCTCVFAALCGIEKIFLYRSER